MEGLQSRDGGDILVELPISLGESVLGGGVPVPTVAGTVTMAIPPGSDSGTKLRLRGKGLPGQDGQPPGDAYATLRVVVGPADDALREFLRDWAPGQAFDPRSGLPKE